MMIDELARKIDNQTVTTEDFNIFIENLPKGADERRMRTHQRLPKKTHRSQSPAKTAQHIARRGEINSPTKTPRGERAVEKQGEKNKKNADDFREELITLRDNAINDFHSCGNEGVPSLEWIANHITPYSLGDKSKNLKEFVSKAILAELESIDG